MRAVWGAAVLAAMGAVAAHADIDPANGVMFPVVVDAAAKTGGDGIKSGDAFYEQTLRSAKAVRITADLPVVYKSYSRWVGNLAPASKNALVVKAGQLLVAAQHGGVEIFCTTVSDKTNDTLGRIYEIAVCLKDDNNDGVFDAAINFESYPYRVRLPYEIGAIFKTDWQPVSVAYDVLAPADIPPIRLSMRYAVREKPQHSIILSALLKQMEAHIEATICWPDVMLAETAGRIGECGIMDWFALKDVISNEPNAKGMLSLPDVSLTWQRNEDATLKVEVSKPLSAGPALLTTGSWIVMGTEIRNGTLVVKITPQR